MRTSNKIIFLGLIFVFLIFTCSTLPFSDTSASFSDTKHTNAEITAGLWETPASMIGLSDPNLTAKSEKLNRTVNSAKGDNDSTSTYENTLAENFSNNVSSFLNNISSAENLTNNSSKAVNRTITLTEASENNMSSSMDLSSSMSSSSGSTTTIDKDEEIIPVANFRSNVTEGYTPLTVQFTDLSENVTEWNWEFGDGDTSSEQDPVHTYSATGTYEVSLIANNENGTDSKLATITIHEQPDGAIPVANFTSNVTDGFAPLTVQFTDLSQNATEWDWNFGDGDTSTQQNQMHTFSVAGNYNVNLTVSNKNDTGSKLATINVYEQTAVIPVANFTSNVTDGFAPLTVQFTDLSQNATEWGWNFGDGDTSTDHDPVHIYSAAGNYSVNLTVSNENGTSSKLATITVQKQSAGTLPVANFSSNTTEGYAPLTIQFTDLSENATEWKWDFENGEISTDQNPVHTFSEAGIYKVNLTVNNENDTSSKLTSSKLNTITVLQPTFPVANFTSNLTEGYTPLTVQFTDLSENATMINWNFGDGDTSTEKNPVHLYSATGNYNVNLTANNENGTSSKLATITILQPILPVANFTSNLTEGYVPLTVQFTDLSENVTEREWDFGDGSTSREQEPVHTFSEAGNYSVNLTADNDNGTSTKTSKIIVNKIPR
ncbi:cell surface protein [Methanosarcina barkeri 3]|uniref:Cell surface protein n=1 Tax=Methanosarcina barkeri 3 TaxID=1434107 RepID=A0A0E3SMS8_METBA|nr:PKD domain-containing protein [Methanosarcina barkeri]AKB83661.1 cell surface protein [Methanosarcina barkeri 3]